MMIAMIQYRCVQGDVLDAVAARYYGVAGFDIGLLYSANPGLASLGTHLPKGTIIALPDSARVVAAKSRIQLWD
jgi:phage tail protein X